jgi:hypothetical protein
LGNKEDMMTAVEALGYTASVIVLISLLRESAMRLRVINLVGALTFTVYGLLVDALPVALVNFLIAGIDLWHLRRLAPPQPA